MPWFELLSHLGLFAEVAEFSFDGRSHVKYELPSPLPARRTSIQVLVRTRRHSSVIVSLVSRDQTEYLRLEVSLLGSSCHFLIGLVFLD